MNTKSVLTVLLGFVVGAAGVGFYFLLQPESQQPIAEKPILKLPRDASARDISRCAANMGTHYTQPEASVDINKPFAGPTYAYWGPTGEVLAIEYHISEEGLKTFEGPFAVNLQTEFERSDRGVFRFEEHLFPLFGAAYESFEIKFQDQGHTGYETPHYDFHAWTKSEEYRAPLVCERGEYRAQDIEGIDLSPF